PVLPWLAELLVVLGVEEVVGSVRPERLRADVCRLRAAVQGRNPSGGVHPLDEAGSRQRVAMGGSLLGSSHRKQEPRHGTLRDEVAVGGSDRLTSPDDARVRGLPGGSNGAILSRVGA